MRRLEASLGVVLATVAVLLQSACALTGKPKNQVAQIPPQPPVAAVAVKPAAPPEPLSVPQTQVQLPAEQPINQEALPVPAKVEEAAPAAAASRPARRPPAQPPKPENAPPVAPITAAAATPPTEEVPRVQEVLSPEDKKRLQESADGRKKDTLKALARVKSSRNAEVVRKVRYIKSLLEQVDNAESRNEWRQADSLAEHALILAQELPGVN